MQRPLRPALSCAAVYTLNNSNNNEVLNKKARTSNSTRARRAVKKEINKKKKKKEREREKERLEQYNSKNKLIHPWTVHQQIQPTSHTQSQMM